MAPQKQWLSEKMVQLEGHSRGFMKEKSVKVPALKDLLDRPLDLGCLELADRALKDAGFSGGWSPLTDVLRSLKRHGSSPERVLDLLCFLFESSDEVLQKMDLDDITMEHLKAGRNALQEVIGNVELAVKKGEKTWNCRQVAPWLRYFLSPKWLNWVSYLGSKDLPKLRSMDARASILMTRLTQAEKENDDASLQEASLKTKLDELPIQVQQLTHECERLKEEESQRHAITLQMQQVQPECENLRKRQEEYESERLKEEESRQAVMLQMQQLQLECENLRKRQEEYESERLKEEESRQAVTLQMQQLQLECENLRKRQEQNESERLKEEESKRQEHALQMQQIQSECESLRTKQDELHMQVQQLTHECERLKEEESQRQAVTLQLQQLQLECENLRKPQEENESEPLKEEESKSRPCTDILHLGSEIGEA